ncbi:MAG TPA: PIN domain-containing protein [Methylomirabilota bacterium]|nr:PIN domain-containing protein [Methylomirabilota bacterium]
MILYCDTSFLISRFCEDDRNHAVAVNWMKEFDGGDFVVCEVHLLEFPASVRAATHLQKNPMDDFVARRVINALDRAVNSRIFLRRPVDMVETVAMARSLGETHGWRERHTAFDLWHLAAAWSFSAAAFLTFDKRQARIAKSLGMAG